ncbi:hypothetical protein CYLTODRAFT_493521 [Cylindrobasidium torrendii FP15055 ss-10]|uniref:F-box domain-containing protein n=1 Tax=Cylindrobasidium torrendii FP15055 ss-10 TaxID=1314674 RepID=A0A0D7B0D7_9AGAR|nr:hypothetical protein CYLTODRAFT_493521 [Cylindrobasidium torrendii FP15055 ss-10]
MSQTTHTQVCPRCASPYTMYPDWQSVVQSEQIRKFIENPWLHDFGATTSPTADTFRDYASSLNLDDQVEALKQSIAQLIFQQKLLESLSQTLKAFFAPIHILPADVLVNIFGLCASANARFKVRTEPSTALLLGRVCRRWRNLVINSPLLWSRFPSDWLQFGSRTLAAIAFERSRQVPLYIQLDFYESVVPQRMREELRKSSHHWRRLDVAHSTARIKTDIAELGITGLPLLEELHIKLVRSSQQKDVEVLEFVPDCPKLTRLFLRHENPSSYGSDYEYGDDSNSHESDGQSHEYDSEDDNDVNEPVGPWSLPQNQHFPWHQLTTLAWHINSPPQVTFAILGISKQLETLELTSNSSFEPAELRSDLVANLDAPVTLQHLTSLRYERVRGIMGGLCCPALERLDISNISGQALSKFLSTSNPPLKTLRMGTFHLDWSEIWRLIEVGRIPLLEELIIGNSIGTLYDINTHFEDDMRLPPTKVLTMDTPTPIENIKGGELNAIYLYVRSLWPNLGLKAFNLFTRANYYHTTSVDRSRESINETPLLHLMNKLRDEGLKVTVSYSPSSDPDDVSCREYY